MKQVNYTNMANELLGDELYYKFINEIAKDNKDTNLVDFGKEVVNKCCHLLIKIGMSNKVELDTVKICLEDEIVEISCKEFARKYERYAKEISRSIV